MPAFASAIWRLLGQGCDVRECHPEPDAQLTKTASGAVITPAPATILRFNQLDARTRGGLLMEPAIGSRSCVQLHLAVVPGPPLEQIVLDANLIERLSNTLMDDVHDGRGVMIEGRHWRQDNCATIGGTAH